MMNTNFEPKDKARIVGIVHKAEGRNWKKLALANQMARSIKDSGKALRRAQAAASMGEREVAAVFFVRYGRLTA